MCRTYFNSDSITAINCFINNKSVRVTQSRQKGGNRSPDETMNNSITMSNAEGVNLELQGNRTQLAFENHMNGNDQ